MAATEPLRKKFKRRRTSRGPVRFSTNVSMRCFFYISLQDEEESPSWIRKDELDRIKLRAKAHCKLHRHLRPKKNDAQASATGAATASNGPSSVSIGDAVRCEIRGESLRGMEYLTDVAIGRERRRVRETAIRACVVEQHEQLIAHVLESAASSSCIPTAVDQVKSGAMKMDAGKLAEAYGRKTREALSYSRSVAREDAKVAAEILAEDLKQPSASSPSNTCSIDTTCTKPASSATNQRVAADIIKSFLPRTMSRHRSIFSMQA